MALPFIGSTVTRSIRMPASQHWRSPGLPCSSAPLFAATLLWRERLWARLPRAHHRRDPRVPRTRRARARRPIGRHLGSLRSARDHRRVEGPRPGAGGRERRLAPARRAPVAGARPTPSSKAWHGTPEEDPVIIDFLDRASRLGIEDLRALGAAARARDAGPSRGRARRRLRARSGPAAGPREIEELRAQIAAWEGAQVGPWTWAWASMTDIDRGDVRREAAPALMDAAVAIVARGRVAPDVRDALAGPWLEVVAGRPVLA